MKELVIKGTSNGNAQHSSLGNSDELFHKDNPRLQFKKLMLPASRFSE